MLSGPPFSGDGVSGRVVINNSNALGVSKEIVRYVYPKLLKVPAGKWFKIFSEYDVERLIDEIFKVFERTSPYLPLAEMPEEGECPLCGSMKFYSCYIEFPTDYGSAYLVIYYCLGCRRARVHRDKSLKLHFRSHKIVLLPKTQTTLFYWEVVK